MNKKNKKKIFIIAGELSGDHHGAKLMYHIKQYEPDTTFFGLGGPKMEQEGLLSLVPISKLAVMGFWEVLKKIFFFINLEKKILKNINQIQPDQIILIDYPGMNLRLAKKIKKNHHIPIFYYISPQLWAWKENRVSIIKKYIDSLIVLFPFEVEWYKQFNIDVKYFGHPLIYEAKKIKNNNPKTIKKLTIALCPGSRKAEISKHWPILEQVVVEYSKVNSQVQFDIIKAPGASSQYFKNIVSQYSNISIINKPILQALQTADLAIVSSGTATLECAATYTPMIVIYKMSTLSWFITKRYVKSSFASIVNIIADKEIFRELLQEDLTSKNIISNIISLVNNTNKQSMIKELKNLIKPLNKGNAHQKTAQHIINYEK